VGLAGFVALCALFYRAPHAAVALFVVYAIAHPALALAITPYLSPAKDVFVAAAVTALAAHAAAGTLRRGADAWLVAAVLVLIGLYVVNPAGGHGPAWFHGSRLVVETLVMLLSGYLLPGAARTWRWATVTLIALAASVAIFGLVQQAVGPERLVAAWGYRWGDQVRVTESGHLRSFGSLADPFNYAMVLLLAFAVLATTRRFRPAWATAAVGALLAAGLVASFVRTALVIAAVVGIVALVRRRRAVAAAAATATLVACGVAAGVVLSNDSGARAGSVPELRTLNGRTELWGRALPHPLDALTGRGVGTIGPGAARARSTQVTGGFTTEITDARPSPARPIDFLDSMYLAVVVDVGLLGLALLLVALARATELALRAASAGGEAAWAAGLFVFILLCDGLTRSSLTSVASGMLVMLLTGLALAAAEAQATSPPPAQAGRGGPARAADGGVSTARPPRGSRGG
jgi:hypothetical protein